MPEAVVQGLLVVLLILIWHRRYTRLQHMSARSQVRPRPEISAILERMRKEPSERIDTPTIVEANSELTSEQPPATQPAVPQATGNPGVVKRSQLMYRCTEYDTNGRLQTEVCRVDANGRVLNRPRLVAAPFDQVVQKILNGKRM